MTPPIARPGVMDISPYVGGESKIPGVDRIIKLASNEGAFGPSPKAVEAYAAAGATLHRYPDGSCTALREALESVFGYPADRLVIGAGSDELITLLCRAYAGPGDEVLYSYHGFLMYPIAAKSAGATPVTAPETDLCADVDALLAAVTDKTRLVFIANPNNPTGTYLTADELQRLHAGLPDHVVLVIDAAYAEYVSRNDYGNGDALVRDHANVVMTRTFSKIFALGGARVGWAYCSAEIADVLNRVRGPFNVSSPAQAAALAALFDRGFLEKSRIHNDTAIAWLSEKLRRAGLIVPDSYCNFILARFPETGGKTAAAADAFLKSKGIIVRRMAGYKLPDSLRITIGQDDENRMVADALATFMAQ
ncbi:MAG: histidinol-phosphate transaminase [Magnetospiraceae bacterium]